MYDDCKIDDCDIDYNDIDDSMDGDHDSTLISIGWGTDEDYGYLNYDDY